MNHAAPKRPSRIQSAVLIGLAGVYLVAALWPQLMQQWLPGFTKSSGQWFFLPACAYICLSVVWLVFVPRKNASALRAYLWLSGLAAVALFVVDIGLSVAFFLMTLYASRIPRGPAHTAAQAPRP